jgi:hypothetical protein
LKRFKKHKRNREVGQALKVKNGGGRLGKKQLTHGKKGSFL